MTNVTLPKRTWVDLYDATGITPGTQIQVMNITPNDVRLAATALEPTPPYDHVPLLFGRGSLVNETTDAGAWALCLAGGAVDVREV